MKYADPELLDQLGREYVLGTLRGPARRRFEVLCRTDAAAREVVRKWEDRLLGLSVALPPVEPSASVWPVVQGKLGFETTVRPAPRRVTTRWQFAIAAMLALLAAGLGWILATRTGPPVAIATLAPEGGAAIWSVETYPERGRVRIVVAGQVPAQAGRSYELWALPEGGAPVSLGLMPSGAAETRRLNAAQLTALAASRKIAVSLEPLGGSPTGAPTGPVLYVGALNASS